MGRTNNICLLTIARTGSTHLSSVLANYSRFAAFRELFAGAACRGLSVHVPPRLITLKAAKRDNDPALTAFAAAHPGLFLDRVARYCRWTGKPVISFKILSGQLPVETIETEVLSRKSTRAMLITRRAVDSFISLQKARELSRWVHKNTTEFKPQVDAGAYAEWHAKSAAWYGHWIDWHEANGIELPILRYETDIDGEVAHTLERFSSKARLLGVVLHARPVLKKPRVQRQDQTSDVRDKVSNWTEFEKGLSQRGLDEAAFGHFA
jgi:hypothetical protein